MMTFRLWLFLVGSLAAWPALAQLGPTQPATTREVTGTTATILNTDCGNSVLLSNAAAVAVTLGAAATGGNFVAGCAIQINYTGAAAATITAPASALAGRTTFALQGGGGIQIRSFGGIWNVPLGFGAVVAPGGLIDGDQVTTATASIQGTIKSGTCITMDGTGNKFASVSDSCRTGGLAVPICPNGVGCATTATPDIYPMPFAGAIAASTVPSALCKVSPAATVTFLVKKWTSGNPASSSTLCTGSISTACAVSSCSISSTSLAAGDGLSIEGTEASADATAVISVAVPVLHQ